MKLALRRVLSVLLTIGSFHLSSCGRALDDLDRGIAVLDRAGMTAQELSDTLRQVKDQLNNRGYQMQVEELISYTSRELANAPQQVIDFTRNRLKEDLRAIKATLQGKAPPARTPMLCGAVVTQVDFRDTQRSTVRLNGWNLDVPFMAPSQYQVEVRNKNPERTRLVPTQFVSYPGPYWMTVDVSKTGFPLQNGDCQIVLWKGHEAASISIINSEPPRSGRMAVITRQEKSKHTDYSVTLRIDTPDKGCLLEDVMVVAGGEIRTGTETTLFDGPLPQSLMEGDQITVHISTRHTTIGHQFDGDSGGTVFVRFYTESGPKDVLPKRFFNTHRGDVVDSPVEHVPFTVPSLL